LHPILRNSIVDLVVKQSQYKARTEDIYYFDFEMISQIQKGAVGTFVPPQTGAEEPGGLSP
jgi:hypothetical protein